MTAEKNSCCALGKNVPICAKISFALLILMITSYLFILSRNAIREYNYIGKNPENAVSMMSFSGEGKIVSKPDIAKVQMGLMVEKKNIADAQKESNETMNKFLEKVKTLGIESKDIKTMNYNIYPQYDWTKERQVLRGYQITQNVELKIRNLEKIGDVLALAGEFNLNQVGSLQFDIDNKEKLIESAREEAIQKAKANAEKTAKALGIGLGKIVSFSEGMYNQPEIYNAYPMRAMKGMDIAESSPEIESGSAEIKMNVNITYEVR